MERAGVQVTLICLLLALVTSLPKKDDWDIYSFHINSTVVGRYATTVIRSRVVNRMDESKEIEFHVRIPKNAFISKFKMLIDGQEYDGVVKAKEQAKQQYAEAVSLGQSAGLVSSVGRTLEEFKTSVTIAAHKKVTFELTYEELLKRRLGKYALQIHARPMQPVKDFKVDVHIIEKTGINFIELQGGLSTMILANAITKTHSDKQAWVHFSPSVDQQKTCSNCGDNGMNGDLIVVYDVNRDSSLGDIKRSDGYFVHHFAPKDLPRIPKNVVFVIDQSGSMHGRKMEQTRIALLHILNDLAEDDYFGLISFDHHIIHWKRELVLATKENLAKAMKFVQDISDRGATDINEAVLEGARMLNAQPREGSAPILILLTDGDPTSGVTNLERIQSNVRRAIAKKFPLYCLGFGFDVNFEFLEKMSLQNSGVARRIYEDSDANLQLQGFYEEVATPLLTDVTMVYIGGANLTQTNFSQYYNGSEIVVAGQIPDSDIGTFNPRVVAISNNTTVVFTHTNGVVESNETVSDSNIQRVWAYLTVKQLLEKELQASGAEKDNVKNEALKLSLKYGFVTPFTSMVVTKPLGENTDVLDKPIEGESPPLSQYPGRQSHPGYSGQHPPLGPPPPRGPAGSAPYLLPGVWGASAGGSQGGGFGGSNRFRANRFHSVALGSAGRYHSSPGSTAAKHNSFVTSLLAFDDVPESEPDLDYDMAPSMSPVPFSVSPTFTTPPHRFLLKTDDQSPPLCFDIVGLVRLKLLHHPSSALTVNGELDPVARGFRRIVIHLRPDHHIEVDTNGITVREGQTKTSHSGQHLITVGSGTVIRQHKEIKFTAGGTRIVILIHEEGGEEFLWPFVRRRSLNASVTGFLALKAPVYEEVQQTPSIKLRINNQEIDVTRSDAVDYTSTRHPTLKCWLMPAESALQRSLDDFIVRQL